MNLNGNSLVLDIQGTATIAGMNNTSGSVTKDGAGTLTLTDDTVTITVPEGANPRICGRLKVSTPSLQP